MKRRILLGALIAGAIVGINKPLITAADVMYYPPVIVDKVENLGKGHITHYEPIRPDNEVREFSYEDAQLLMRIAQAEAGNQGIDGMVKVMAVVLNRVADADYPDNIHDVIYQRYHFASVWDGNFDSVELSVDAHLALAYVESGASLDDKIIGFETTSNHRALEKYYDYCYTEGAHDFYIKKGE